MDWRPCGGKMVGDCKLKITSADHGGMSRVVAFLLIPLCLMGQPMPHAHAGLAGKDHHDGRNHVHLGHRHHHSHGAGHRHHHHHDDDARPQGCSELPDHDADAVFLGDLSAGDPLKRVAAPQWDLVIDVSRALLVPLIAVDRVRCRYVVDPPDPSSGTPVYLQTASLRI